MTTSFGFETLIASIKLDNLFGLRDRALIEVLWSTGLRIAECLALPDAVFLSDKNETLELSIVGKGNWRRTIYFSPATLKSIKNYLAVRNTADTLLFPMTIRNAQYIIKRRAEKAGFDGLHPHSLRHSYGTYIISQGENLRIAQELLGHRSITSTQIYTHISSPELRSAHKRLFK
ncbi:MAG: tyrosine-type recombinase/integrase [Patescibacteria group bacterium]